MDYANRLPLIGGLIEMTKSKKGVAFIAAIVVLLGGGVAGVENEILLIAATTVLTYIGGQSYVDARQQAGTINSEVGKVLEIVNQHKDEEAPAA